MARSASPAPKARPPSVDRVVRAARAEFAGGDEPGHEAIVAVARSVVAGERARLTGDRAAASVDDARSVSDLAGEVTAQLRALTSKRVASVINATGVIVHTNLGRAPLAEAAIDGIARVARGYSSLEYDIGRGTRGRRDIHAEALLCRLTGAESAVVVNNNAAATLLVLAALAAGREVIVSRGELVEIGGGFRVPDVMAQSGAALREIGTTNKTRAADYAAAISDRTALILRVHPSNFRIEGFTERPALAEVVAVARTFNLPVLEDLGSGHLGSEPGSSASRLHEPAVGESLAAGVEVCCFSGDKLLGGPQAGIIVGRPQLVDRVRRHPLMRALRVDKLTYAALEATLAEYAAGRAVLSIPVQQMLAMTADDIRARADALAARVNELDGWQAVLVAGTSAVGGGSAPGIELPTWLLSLERRGLTANALEERLRGLVPPVIARIETDRVLLDLRTVLPEQDQQLLGLLKSAAL